MGIKGLTKLLNENAPNSFKESKFENFFGRKIAVDASMHIYQFLAVVGRTGDQLLTNDAGEVTSHLQGMFFRTARMLEAGIKPVFVFDGKPPEAKYQELQRRGERRGEADAALAAAKEAGNEEDIEKYSKRTTKVTNVHNEECKKLLQLMGVPYIDAPSEAEAQCAAMCKDGLVWGISTEDMDALTFATPRLIRNLMAGASQKLPINVYEFDEVLKALDLNHDEFIDMCILCGCDYCGTVKGIGATTALKLIQRHRKLIKVLETIDTQKNAVPDPFPHAVAFNLFKNPKVLSKDEIPPLKWAPVNEENLLNFLVTEKSFNADRVRAVIKKINHDRGKSNQGRLESFFTVKKGKSNSVTKQLTKRARVIKK